MRGGHEDHAVLLDELRAIARAPLARARALPRALYTSAEVHEAEQRSIFAREWLCIGREAEAPGPGDYLTSRVADQPVFVVRGSDGVLRGFANACRHRMMRLLEGRGCTRKRIVCPYHGWAYGLDGALVHAGQMERTEGFERRAVRLAPVRTETWQGWIYVTLDEGAPPVAERLARLTPVVERYRMDRYVPVAAREHRWRTNWKVLTENFMETYHVPVAHRATIGPWTPVEEVRFPARRSDAFTYQTFHKTADATFGRAHRENRHLRGRWRRTAVMPTVFPSHMFVLAPDHLWYLAVSPRGVGEVDVRFGAALAPEVLEHAGDRDALVASAVEFFDAVNEEDRRVVEAVFENAGAPLSAPGRLSWLERSLHDFARYLSARLEGA